MKFRREITITKTLQFEDDVKKAEVTFDVVYIPPTPNFFSQRCGVWVQGDPDELHVEGAWLDGEPVPECELEDIIREVGGEGVIIDRIISEEAS